MRRSMPGLAAAAAVLVLEPGTSAGSAYFVPLARWIVARDKGWLPAPGGRAPALK